MTVLYIYKFNSSYKETSDNYWIVYYHKPYCRIGPYLIGLISALYLYSFKNETAQESYFKRAADRLHNSKYLRWSFYLIG